MTEKQFKLPREAVKPIAPNRGACIASDHIVIEGRSVGFMYREAPGNSVDSGWRFFSGEETQGYIDDPDHLAYYDINTVANYDPAIIPYLDSAIGTAFGRIAGTNEFEEEKYQSEE